jgi:hypothetical protein
MHTYCWKYIPDAFIAHIRLKLSNFVGNLVLVLGDFIDLATEMVLC